jgi:hypothetical protein
MPEAEAVHPKCAKSSSGTHARPSRAKADTPRCSAFSTSYCCRPRPASCTPSRCRQRRHCHCLCRARWRIDRPPHRAHPWRAPEIIVSPVFDEEGFDCREEASLQIPETTQHSKECFVRGGVHTQEISSRIPSIDKRRPTSPWPHTRRMVEQVPCRLRRSAKGSSEVAPTRAAISMRRS